MAVLPKYALKLLFESGDLITQSTLYDLIDATYNPTLVAGTNITLNQVITPVHAEEVTKRPGLLRTEPSILDQILHVQTDRDRSLRITAPNARTHTFEPRHCRSASWWDTAVRILIP